YAHSPVHVAVANSDHALLRRLISAVPYLPKPGEVTTESESLAAEIQADKVSAVIDRRDVPGRETPLHLAVRLRDPISAEILMSAGADWSLQNEQGWSALQEAVCNREESIALVIACHYQPLAWAKWCRRLPRIIASASRILHQTPLYILHQLSPMIMQINIVSVMQNVIKLVPKSRLLCYIHL
ncbi:uncharacterized protein LOC127095404, partial [Lathyrus oleraceus]|uniref:uncharacterized protein LOC127095404 n=1 Tax=Pisum sativum TaxID=3888 RepID=UPI0021D10E45